MVLHAGPGLGLLTVGTGKNTSPVESFGDLNLSHYRTDAYQDGDTGELLRQAFKRSRHVHVLPGVYPPPLSHVVLTDDVELSGSPGAKLKPKTSGAIGLFDFQGPGTMRLRGFSIEVPTFVPGQTIVKASGARNVEVDSVIVDCTDATATGFDTTSVATMEATRQIVFAFHNVPTKSTRFVTVYPNKGIQAFFAESTGALPDAVVGQGWTLIGVHVKNKSSTLVSTQALCFRGVEAKGDEFGRMLGCFFFELGSIALPCDAALFLRGHALTPTVEAGHWLVAATQFERCASLSTVKLWGAGACTFHGVKMGLMGPQGGTTPLPDAEGEAAIVVDSLDGTAGGNPTLGFTMQACEMHNCARTGDGAFVWARRVSLLEIIGSSFGFCTSAAALRVVGNNCEKIGVKGNSFRGASGGRPMRVIDSASAAPGSLNITGGFEFSGNGWQGFTETTPCLVDAAFAPAAQKRIIVRGLQATDTGNDPGVGTTADLLTTNVRLDA